MHFHSRHRFRKKHSVRMCGYYTLFLFDDPWSSLYQGSLRAQYLRDLSNSVGSCLASPSRINNISRDVRYSLCRQSPVGIFIMFIVSSFFSLRFYAWPSIFNQVRTHTHTPTHTNTHTHRHTHTHIAHTHRTHTHTHTHTHTSETS